MNLSVKKCKIELQKLKIHASVATVYNWMSSGRVSVDSNNHPNFLEVKKLYLDMRKKKISECLDWDYFKRFGKRYCRFYWYYKARNKSRLAFQKKHDARNNLKRKKNERARSDLNEALSVFNKD